MAIYHLSAQIIGRSAGRSSVAAAAYRAGERIRDERTGQVYDYGKRKDVEAQIYTPGGAPEWMKDRTRLWNAVEESEKRKDAQLAREMNLALPKELDVDRQREVVRSFVKEEFTKRGMVGDVAIHRNDPENPHAHVMLSMRDVTPEGFGPKNREWNRKELLEEWREKWAAHANRELERAGLNERIDHRTLVAQGIDREPTRHLGPAAAAMERKRIPTERGELARAAQDYPGAVIDFEKAKRELEQARAAAGRVGEVANWKAQRAREGYFTPEDARAVAEVELRHAQSLGGRPMTRAQADALWKNATGEAEKAREAVRKIEAFIEERRRYIGTVNALEGAVTTGRQAEQEFARRHAVAHRVPGTGARTEYLSLRTQREQAERRLEQHVRSYVDGKTRQPSGFTTAEQVREAHRASLRAWEPKLADAKESAVRRERELALYSRAAGAFARAESARYERDPAIRQAHADRMHTHCWDRGGADAVRQLEAREGRPLARKEVEALAARAEAARPKVGRPTADQIPLDVRALYAYENADDMRGWVARRAAGHTPTTQDEIRLETRYRDAWYDFREEFQPARLARQERLRDARPRPRTRHRVRVAEDALGRTLTRGGFSAAGGFLRSITDEFDRGGRDGR